MFATNQFEGPEKKLEIILSAPQPDIRTNTDKRWNNAVEASRAGIISQISSDKMDAYLLSESSLFVWDDRILMITCGKTTLVQALPEILKIVDKQKVAFVFYERKNCLFPDAQPTTFEDDVDYLVSYFPGKFYTLGPANEDHVKVFYSSHGNAVATGDATLELLMHQIAPDAKKFFCGNPGNSPVQAETNSGLEKIYPEMHRDGYLFSPCGYSLNGIADDRYFTVHVTPQDGSSYTSFETNVIEPDYLPLINQVVSIFKPGKFSLVLTTSMDDACLTLHDTVVKGLQDYKITDKTLYEFDCGYCVTFLNYVREKIDN